MKETTVLFKESRTGLYFRRNLRETIATVMMANKFHWRYDDLYWELNIGSGKMRGLKDETVDDLKIFVTLDDDDICYVIE